MSVHLTTEKTVLRTLLGHYLALRAFNRTVQGARLSNGVPVHPEQTRSYWQGRETGFRLALELLGIAIPSEEHEETHP